MEAEAEAVWLKLRSPTWDPTQDPENRPDYMPVFRIGSGFNQLNPINIGSGFESQINPTRPDRNSLLDFIITFFVLDFKENIWT